MRTPLRSRLLLALLATAAALLLAEGLGRLLYPDLRLKLGRSFHPVLGWTQSPGLDWTMTIDEEVVHQRANRLGFRDAEHEWRKPAGMKRLVAVGDSFTEELQVKLEVTFVKRLEGMLNESAPGRWEGINLGVGDFGTAQEWLALERYGFAYDPDVVLCQVFPLNDIGNNSLGLCDLCESEYDGLRPYFVERGGALVLETAQPLRNLLRRNLLSFGLLEWFVRRRIGSAVTDPAWRMRRLAELGQRRLDPLFNTYSEDADQIPPVAQGWRITEKVLAKMVAACRDRSVAFAALVIPWDRHVGEAGAEWTRSLPESGRWIDGGGLAPPSPDYPERRLEKFFRGLGVPCVTMRPIFERHEGEIRPSRLNHMNPAAHRLTAEALYAMFEAEGFVR